MTYEDDNDLVRSVLVGELDKQRAIAESAARYLAALEQEIAPLVEKRDEANAARVAALALIESLELVLAPEPGGNATARKAAEDSGNGYEYETPPLPEDPYEAAFETTTEAEPAKDQTFDHRAPMLVKPVRTGPTNPADNSDDLF
jgi:hypothetical protein